MATDGFVRATKHNPCPVCGKPDWCTVNEDGSVAFCMRVESNKRAGNGGYVHVIDPTAKLTPRRKRRREVRNQIDFGPVAHDGIGSMSEYRLGYLSEELSVSIGSLVRLGVGWLPDRSVYLFPMRDGGDKIVGVRIRGMNGRKWSLKGSRSGLFVPRVMNGSGPLLICEGPTDTAAALDLGYDAIGRPDCRSTVQQLIRWLRNHRHGRIVIVPDNDEPKPDGKQPGVDGGRALQAALRRVRIETQMIVPPAKDLRAWVNSGATRHDFCELIGNDR